MKDIPKDLVSDFRMGGKIPISYRYFDGGNNVAPRHYSVKDIDYYFKRAAERKCNYYGATDTFFYDALDKYSIKNKKVLVIGSCKPCYEAICLYRGAHVTVSEYADITCDVKTIKYIKPESLENVRDFYDVVVSISSYEHTGLGRYGDPIDPLGDLDAMIGAARVLKKKGLMFLAVPRGQDEVVWNEKRVYGNIRFPLLVDGYNILAKYGKGLQPIFVLENNKDEEVNLH